MPEGIVTLANMKISAVDGVAFVDFGNTNALIENIGRLLKIYDSSRRAIVGRIYQAGTGETLDAELLTNGDFAADLSDWDLTLGAGGGAIAFDAGTMKFTQGGVSASMFASQDQTTVIGSLIKLVAGSIANYTQNFLGLRIGTAQNGDQIADTGYFGAATKTLYGTITAITAWFSLRDGQAATKISNWDDISAKKVLTPSVTGVKIVSEDMETQNWVYKNASFNYKDTSGYTFDFEREIPRGIARGKFRR